jgi:hypothetical protein
MKVLVPLFIVLFCFSLNGMEVAEEFRPSEWPSVKLQRLLDESKEPTCNEFNRVVRELKKEFAYKYLDKYHDQQEILKDLLRETNGVVRATTDPELAKEDPNKFLCLDALQCTADEIDARWKLIHHADCKYISECVAKYGSYENRPVSSGKQ